MLSKLVSHVGRRIPVFSVLLLLGHWLGLVFRLQRAGGWRRRPEIWQTRYR